MSLVVAWIGVDSRKPSSLYFASDSRISWEIGDKLDTFDYCRKVFGCSNSPDIFAYCGDVLFPSIAINQLVTLADRGVLFEDSYSSEQKFQKFFAKLAALFNKYPKEVETITSDVLEILHGSREQNGIFFCRKMVWTRKSGSWRAEDVRIKDFSDKAFVCGSGRDVFIERYKIYSDGPSQRTSRAVFQSFCDILELNLAQTVGGAPQLVGLYNKFNSKSFGLIYKKKRFYEGLQVDDLNNFSNLEWRNNLFERCDGDTLGLLVNAQRQPNPLHQV